MTDTSSRSRGSIRAASRRRRTGSPLPSAPPDIGRVLSFPDYHTAIGTEIGNALQGRREYAADTMQLLYIANRYEYRPHLIEAWLAAGAMVICDRYLASSIAYGEAQGLDAAWLIDTQRHLPQPSLTLLLDIPPEASLRRKQADRDKFERDLALLGRVRSSYQRQSEGAGWVRLDGHQDKDAVSAPCSRPSGHDSGCRKRADFFRRPPLQDARRTPRASRRSWTRHRPAR